MSEALRYEDLLTRIKALEARVKDLEAEREPQLSEADALKDWDAFLIGAEVSSITRTWREVETPDLQASALGLSDAAKDKLRQSMTRNAWALLEEECAMKGTELRAHPARVRILRIVQQLQEMGEIPGEKRGEGSA